MMILSHTRNRSGRPEDGFTLVELLVSMAIFITVMSGVTLLFNSAIRTSKQGFQNQEAYEIARGVFNILERDLSRMYIAREMGHKHTFYGTPYGFTFIGMIDSEDGSQQNLARFTYVIHQTVGRKTLEAVVTSDNENLPENELVRNTYSLIRFVEPGVDSLDSFPVDWKNTFLSSDLGGGSMEDMVGNVFFEIITANLLVDATNTVNPEPLCNDNDPDCRAEIVRAGKRELWLRMMAGDRVFRTVFLPDIWNLLGRDPADYVIAENLLYVELEPDSIDDSLLVVIPKFTDLAFNLNHIAQITYEPVLGPDSINTRYSPVEFNQDRISPKDYFFAYRTIGERNRRNDLDTTQTFKQKVRADGTRATRAFPGLLGGLWETEFIGIDFGYWNDFRNLEYVRNISRIDSIIFTNLPLQEDEVIIEKLNETIEGQMTTVGSPLGGDTPESIIVNLTLFFESIYAGAPDFQRTFTQIFDVPSGHKRSVDSLGTQLFRRPE
ncbi:MAG: hypothetical protein COA73_02860 [Candidatus Hydrogenedentota bacterium]|nr:MAG: hypothetical protein COA73_02860 [Candidatus Hydrogenedentota bacterium]